MVGLKNNNNFILITFLIISLFGLTFAIDCSLVKCAKPVCPLGTQLTFSKGKCCGECQSCEGVPCNKMIRFCGIDEEPTGCCPCVKKPDCSTVKCAIRTCRLGEIPDKTKCCSCRPGGIQDCSLVKCTKEIRYCNDGEIPIGCCPCVQKPDCSTVKCAIRTCNPGELPDLSKCCSCRPEPDCSNVACTMEIRYCKEGEKPEGCCPCTIPQYQ